MTENCFPSTQHLQKKFYEWFKVSVSTDSSLPAKAIYPPRAKSLQEKFHEWFIDPVSADPPAPVKTRRKQVLGLRKLIDLINNTIIRADVAYLSLGLFIGMSATGLFLTGMLIPPRIAAAQPAATATVTPTAYTSTPAPLIISTVRHPTITYTPTPTLIKPTSTPTATDTATPTPTVPSPTPTFSAILTGFLQNGYLSQAGPLGLRDQIKVYETSLKYVRTSTEESQLLGEQINGRGYGSPSDICGPLSIAILQETGIVLSDIDPHAFWLLNPDVRGDRKLLSKAFPTGQFDNIRVQVNLNKVNWNETPLYPGDFVYLYAGTGGNFEHMLVVNRVDTDGRAFAVTNHKTPDGFIISEVLLYNPDNPDVGMFPVWTARPNADAGSTGFAGFEIWRRYAP